MSNVFPHSSTTILQQKIKKYVKANLDLAKFLPSNDDNENIRKRKKKIQIATNFVFKIENRLSLVSLLNRDSLKKNNIGSAKRTNINIFFLRQKRK